MELIGVLSDHYLPIFKQRNYKTSEVEESLFTAQPENMHKGVKRGQILLTCAPEKGSVNFEHVQKTFYSTVNRTLFRENTRVILTRVQKHAQTTNERWHTCWQKVQDLQNNPVRVNPPHPPPPIKKTKSIVYARSPRIRLAS